MVDKGQIEQLVKLHFRTTGRISIDSQGLVSCTGHVELVGNMSQLPVQFAQVDGDFDCYHNKLTSLAGSPRNVGGNFFCGKNKLTSLAGAPSHVLGAFYCHENKLTSLEGAPKHVGGNFDCHQNKLASLAAAPSYVGGNFHCHFNKLTSLEGAPRHVPSDTLVDTYLPYLCYLEQAVNKDPDQDVWWNYSGPNWEREVKYTYPQGVESCSEQAPASWKTAVDLTVAAMSGHGLRQLDLHKENMMLRGNTLVITDPWYRQ